MALLERLQEELKGALRGKDGQQATAIRMLLAAVHAKEKNNQAEGKEPKVTDDETVEVLQKEAKKRKEAMEIFAAGGRQDLADKERYELKLISAHIPAAASREEINVAIDAILASGASDFSSVMKQVMARLKGRADGRDVSARIKAKLQ